jgi:hypothetical protein
LIKVILAKSKKAFILLRDKYKDILSVDPFYEEIISNIGFRYFEE